MYKLITTHLGYAFIFFFLANISWASVYWVLGCPYQTKPTKEREYTLWYPGVRQFCIKSSKSL